jgi:hypothetical protein
MRKEYEPILKHIMAIPNTFDNIFDITNKSIVVNLGPSFIEDLNRNRPSEKELEKIKDDMLDKTAPEQGIEKKQTELSRSMKLERLWTLPAQVLKNTEEISDVGLKDSAYEQILLCSMAFSNLYKFYIEEHIKKLKSMSQIKIDENLIVAQKMLPLIHEIVLFSLMGTSKLGVVIKDKIIKDATGTAKISDFEKFISVFLYADIRGRDYQKYIRNFIKNIKRTYIYDMTLFKLITFYYFRSKNKESDIFYEELIAELIVVAKGLDKKEKSKIIQDYKLKKRKRIDLSKGHTETSEIDEQ